LTLRSKVKVPRRSLRYATHHLMVMHPHTKYHWHISKEKNVMARTRKYYLKTIILPWGQRSRSYEDHYGIRHIALWSCTHIPNNYYLKNNYLTLRSKVKVPRRSLRYATHHLMVMHPHTKYHWPISKEKNVMAQTRKYYLKTIIWPWGQRSRSHEDHYGMQHIALWSCTHIPNIIDRSGKTKQLWSGQDGSYRLRWEEAEEAEAEEKIRLKQNVSVRSKGRHNNEFTIDSGKILSSQLIQVK
jgi:hypothetical protein